MATTTEAAGIREEHIEPRPARSSLSIQKALTGLFTTLGIKT